MPLCLFFVSTLLLSFLAGCGSDGLPTAPVEGKVLYKGKPLEFGTVLFQPEKGPPARGNINQDGTFCLSTYGKGDGAIVGVNSVQITCYECQHPDATPQKSSAYGELIVGKSLVPPKYTKFYTSGLRVEVKSISNEPFLFDLK